MMCLLLSVMAIFVSISVSVHQAISLRFPVSLCVSRVSPDSCLSSTGCKLPSAAFLHVQ